MNDNKTITIKRIFNAPLESVWDAWSKADQIKQWWGPNGMPVIVTSQDFVINGKWEYRMTMPNGKDFISEGVYAEIEDYKRIYTSANFKPMTEGIEMDIRFESKNGATEFIFSCIHPTEEYCKQQEEMGAYKGWGAAFDRLEAFLAI